MGSEKIYWRSAGVKTTRFLRAFQIVKKKWVGWVGWVGYLRGSRGLSARRSEGQSRGPRGPQIEVSARRVPRLLSIILC